MRPESADQAEGLRRLMRIYPRVINVMAGKPGVGRSSVILNLAALLVSAGKEVLILDECQAQEKLSERPGMYCRHDLLDVINGGCTLDEVVVTTRGYAVLPAARAMSALAEFKPEEQHRLENALAEVSRGIDVMLVDSAMFAGHAAVSSCQPNGASLLVVVDATASGITGCYSLIKRLAVEHDRLQFEVLVNKAANAQAAAKIFDNMAKVARQNLAASLVYLGFVPYDDKLTSAARQGRAVVDMFPNSASAQAYHEIAQRLLHPPMHQGKAGTGASTIMQCLIRQTAQPLRRPSKALAQVVK